MKAGGWRGRHAGSASKGGGSSAKMGALAVADGRCLPGGQEGDGQRELRSQQPDERLTCQEIQAEQRACFGNHRCLS